MSWIARLLVDKPRRAPRPAPQNLSEFIDQSLPDMANQLQTCTPATLREDLINCVFNVDPIKTPLFHGGPWPKPTRWQRIRRWLRRLRRSLTPWWLSDFLDSWHDWRHFTMDYNDEPTLRQLWKDWQANMRYRWEDDE